MNMNIKDLPCHPGYIKKVEKWSLRCTQETPEEDTIIIIEGKERTGKTNGSIYTAGLAREITKRPISLFFNVKDVIDFAKRTEKQIIIWDEPALQSLTGDMLKRINQNLRRLLMTCGVKRHFIIINIINFTRFDSYLTVERPHGMIHLFKGRIGHACYIRMKNLEQLREIWLKKHKRAYVSLKSHYFDFPVVDSDLFNSLDMTINGVRHATYKDYDRMKKKAIENIGEEDDDIKDDLRDEIKRLKYLISTEPKGLRTDIERALHYKISSRTFRVWKSGFDGDVKSESGLDGGDVAVLEPEEEGVFIKKGNVEGEI